MSQRQYGTQHAIVGLGGNAPFQGMSSAEVLTAALAALADAGLTPLRVSRFWRTTAIGASGAPEEDAPPFLNAVALIDAGARTPEQVYAILAGIELRFGRTRRPGQIGRTLDLDLLDLGGRVQGWPGSSLAATHGALVVPHPRLHQRAFVLGPLTDIAPDWRHPALDRTASQLWAELQDGALAAPIVAEEAGSA